jgi:AcrR family transcriptional regulator
MSPVAPDPSTRDCLLEAAIFCFAELGYEGASVRDIAKRAGKPTSLIGYYFAGKEGLYIEVFQRLIALNPQNPLPTFNKLDRVAAVRALRQHIEAFFGDVMTYQGEPLRVAGFRLFMSEMQSPRPMLHELFRARMLPYTEHMKAVLAVLRPDLSSKERIFLGQCIHGLCMVHRLAAGMNLLSWGPDTMALSMKKMTAHIATLALRGLGITPEEMH